MDVYPPAPRLASVRARKKIRCQADPEPTPTPRRDPIAFGVKAIRGIVENKKKRVEELQEEALNLSTMKGKVNDELLEIEKDLAFEAKRLAEVQEKKKGISTQIESNESVLLLDGLAAEIEKINPETLTFFLNLCAVEKNQLEAVKDLEGKRITAKAAIEDFRARKDAAKAELATLERDIVSYEDCIGEMKCLKPQQCVICIAAAATHAFLPCGHRSVCEQCAKKFGVGNPCPICKKAIDDTRKIFFDCPAKN